MADHGYIDNEVIENSDRAIGLGSSMCAVATQTEVVQTGQPCEPSSHDDLCSRRSKEKRRKKTNLPRTMQGDNTVQFSVWRVQWVIFQGLFKYVFGKSKNPPWTKVNLGFPRTQRPFTNNHTLAGKVCLFIIGQKDPQMYNYKSEVYLRSHFMV